MKIEFLIDASILHGDNSTFVMSGALLQLKRTWDLFEIIAVNAGDLDKLSYAFYMYALLENCSGLQEGFERHIHDCRFLERNLIAFGFSFPEFKCTFLGSKIFVLGEY